MRWNQLYLKKMLTGLSIMFSLTGCGGVEDNAAPEPYPTSQQTGMNSNLSLDLPQQFAPTASRYPMTASRSYRVVHRTDCALVDKVNPGDREHFRAFKQAQDQGYKPCEICRPDKP